METERVEEGTELQTFHAEPPEFLKRAMALEVNDTNSYNFACDFVIGIRDRKKSFLSKINPLIKKINDAHKGMTSERKRTEDAYDAVINEAFGKATFWWNEQESIRQIAEAKEMAALKAKEEEARLAEAVELEKAGESERAEEIISAPMNIAKPFFQKTEKKLGTRETWYAVVDNKMALIKAVATGKQPHYYLDANMSNLNTQAVKLRDELRIPGVTPKSKEGPSGK